MKQNMGSLDRVLRLIATITVALLYVTNQISGITATVLGLMSLIFVFTSFVGFCPLYIPLKLSTKRKASDKS